MAGKKRIRKASKRVYMQQMRKKKALIILAVSVLAIIFGGSGFAMKNYVEKVDENVICDNIYIGPLEVSGMTEEEAVKALEEQIQKDESKVMTLSAGKGTAEVFLKELGYGRAEIEKRAKLAVEYGKTGSMWNRYHQMKRLEKQPYIIEDTHVLDEEKAEQLLKEKAEPLLQKAVDASISRDEQGKLTVQAEKEGEVIDVKETMNHITDYLNKEWDHQDFALKAVTKVDKPKIRAKDLEQVRDELGSFSTDAGGGTRWTNLKTGIEKLNGTILMPGEELSVYDATAPYDKEHGYAEGTAYENGQVVPSFGGGICQVSTTLYNAVIYAELEIVERYPHSMTVDYVEPSRDAAIAGGFMDLRFKNSYETPIYIFGEIDADNQLKVIIYGKETRPKNRRVEFVSETLSVDEYSVVYKANSEMAFGEMKYTGSPHTGREARLWKVVYEDGTEVEREIFNTSSYEKSDEVIEIGTSGGSKTEIEALETAIASQDKAAIDRAIAAKSGGSEESKNETETEG